MNSGTQKSRGIDYQNPVKGELNEQSFRNSKEDSSRSTYTFGKKIFDIKGNISFGNYR